MRTRSSPVSYTIPPPPPPHGLSSHLTCSTTTQVLFHGLRRRIYHLVLHGGSEPADALAATRTQIQ
jgi:hypothetical protein